MLLLYSTSHNDYKFICQWIKNSIHRRCYHETLNFPKIAKPEWNEDILQRRRMRSLHSLALTVRHHHTTGGSQVGARLHHADDLLWQQLHHDHRGTWKCKPTPLSPEEVRRDVRHPVWILHAGLCDDFVCRNSKRKKDGEGTAPGSGREPLQVHWVPPDQPGFAGYWRHRGGWLEGSWVPRWAQASLTAKALHQRCLPRGRLPELPGRYPDNFSAGGWVRSEFRSVGKVPERRFRGYGRL